MAINERLIDTEVAAAGNGGAGTGNQEEGLILHLDANDVDSYDGDGSEWVDITNHEYTPTTNVSEHFNTVLYTGNGTTNQITDVGFQPDFIWVKRRSSASNHYIVDTVRGNGTNTYKNLSSNTTDTEGTTTSSGITNNTIVDGGFTMQGTGARTNANGSTYVAWCFKAGGAAVSNTDGTITSQVSANNDLGFSIVKYTGNGSSSEQTVGHGLGVKPEMVIIKDLNNTRDWYVYTDIIDGSMDALYLNTEAAKINSSRTYPTSLVYKVAGTTTLNKINQNFISYCFTSKRGVSKVGTYKGTGAAGNKVYTGFEPAFVMLKVVTNSTGSWRMYDNVRGITNALYPNLNYAEATNQNRLTFDNDGFTLISTGSSYNANNRTYIYYAVAKNTNETSLIPDTDLELHIDLGDSSCYSGSGTTVNDLSSNSHTVTTLAGVQEADFDKEVGGFLTVKENSNEGLTISDHADFDHTNGATYEGWVYLDSNGTSEETFLWRGPSSSGAGLRIYWHASYGWFPRDFNASSSEIIDQNNIKTGTSGFGRGKWYHLALTLSSASAATYKFYVDGNLIGSYTASGGGQNSLSYGISLGKYVGGGVTDLHGKIGQFRLYSSALTQDQIRQNYNFTKPNYPNGFDGTINGATWNSAGYFQFDGSNDEIELTKTEPYSSQEDQTNSIKSITGWVKLDTGTRAILYSISSINNSNDYFTCQVRNDSNGVFMQCRNGGSTNQFTDKATNSAPDSNWHHYVFQIDGDEREIYIDGVKKTLTKDNRGTATDSSWISYPSYSTSVKHKIQKGRESSAYYGTGKISKVKHYTRPLTQAEITALYNEGE